MTYRYLHLRNPAGQAPALTERLVAEAVPRWREAGATVWGMWQGLFGLASTDLFVIVHGPASVPDRAGVVEARVMDPTARPAGPEPCRDDGLYVFRRFEIDNADTARVIALSTEGWKSFETSSRYRSRPMGLFADADQTPERGVMMLVTWYPGLAAWETSRDHEPGARENFARRRALLHSTTATATRLAEPWLAAQTGSKP